ncbi:MAG TPA: hypothetical protein PLD50_25335, partial [Polyangiaceae bacterium]|nr:hypothetical protein [Polyangiaceae bacterium]
ATVVWFPVGLTLLEGALSRGRASPIGNDRELESPISPWQRVSRLFLFGAVFAEQIFAGFPQSAYISALVYGCYAIFRASTLRGRVLRIPVSVLWLALSGAVVGLAMMAGAIVLRPLSSAAQAALETRRANFIWGSMVPYWPRNALTFLFPYINGDVSDGTYEGPSLFWEDYGYVGIATFLLAVYALVRERRRSHVIFLGVMTIVAYMMVLGRNTPIFFLAWKYLPGLNTFRFPTRFLFVVDFGLVILGGIGLARFGRDLTQWWKQSVPRAPAWIVIGLCTGTALDLFYHQSRQNAMVSASEWLSPPEIVKVLRKENGDVRTYTHRHQLTHRVVNRHAKGWSTLEHYYDFRDSLQPNSGVYWGIPAADCYAGMAPRWVVNTWGDHNEPGILLFRSMKDLPVEIPPPPALLGTLGVTHLISSFKLKIDGYTPIAFGKLMHVYRVEGAQRVRMAAKALIAANDNQAADYMLDRAFDPNREVVVHDPPAGFETKGHDINPQDMSRKAQVIRRSDTEVEIEATASQGAYLFLAETYQPSWQATVDGVSTPVVRANMMGRAVWVPPGTHRILFFYPLSRAWIQKLLWSAGVFVFLIMGGSVAGWYARKNRRVTALKAPAAASET